MSDPIARAKAINDKYQAEVAAAIYAINKAIVLIGVIVLMGVSFWVADQKIADTDRTNQESINVVRR